MTAPAIDLSPLLRRWRALLGALALACVPGLAHAASEPDEWPTTPDRGAGSPKKIPWLRFSGDPNAPVVVPAATVRGGEVIVLREQEPSARQRRLLRRAARHAEKAAKLRDRAGARETRYAVVVPGVSVVQVPQAPPAPPPPVVVHRGAPAVHVVHVEDADHDCDDDHDDDHDDERDERRAQAPAGIDADRIAADVEREVERALRGVDVEVARALREADVERKVERALQEVERARAHAERTREHARRDVERARERAERGAERAERAREQARRAERDAARGPKGRR